MLSSNGVVTEALSFFLSKTQNFSGSLGELVKSLALVQLCILLLFPETNSQTDPTQPSADRAMESIAYHFMVLSECMHTRVSSDKRQRVLAFLHACPTYALNAFHKRWLAPLSAYRRMATICPCV